MFLRVLAIVFLLLLPGWAHAETIATGRIKVTLTRVKSSGIVIGLDVPVVTQTCGSMSYAVAKRVDLGDAYEDVTASILTAASSGRDVKFEGDVPANCNGNGPSISQFTVHYD